MQRWLACHRVAYAKAHQLDVHTMGGVVRHTCDNPGCVNPEHLVLGSQADNVADMVAKGRGVALSGSESPHSKVTRNIVESMRRRYKPRCRVNGCSALAREFGLHQTTVSLILSGKTWCSLHSQPESELEISDE